jgi:peptidyl-prolyl cis-trans isomerase D
MFDFVRKHTRLFFFVLLVVIIPSFVFVGIQGYTPDAGGSGTVVAEVGGVSITQAEWDKAHLDQVERMRRQMPDVDVKAFDSVEMKNQTLETLLRQQVLLTAADRLHYVITDDRLDRLFKNDPQFAFLRNPDGSLNKDMLASQGMSSQVLAQRLRQDLATQQVLQGVSTTTFAPLSLAGTTMDALFEQREVQLQRFDAKDYVAKVNPTEAELEAYYKDPANSAQFQAPEQADVQYVVLSVEALSKGITISEEELKKNYDDNIKLLYTTPEERRASHILVQADKDASAAAKQEAKAKAEALLVAVRKAPATFAEVARKNSQDTASAEQGGDLDFFRRDAMTKPFADAAFNLKVGDISDVVETDFGYHIILVTGKRGGETRSFESVRAELENEARTQLAQKKFAEAAGDFTNMVFEQAESLAPVAEKFKLELLTAQGVTRSPSPQAEGPLANAKFLEAIFSNESIQNKRNTDAIDIGASQLVAGRVVQYSPARLVPLADAREKVRAVVVAKQAAALARKDGEARLAALKQAPQTTLTEPSLKVSRAQPAELSRQLLDAMLRVPADTLPTATGVDLGLQGYAVIRVNKVLGRDPVTADTAGAQSQYAQAWGTAETQAYYAALKSRFKAEVKVKASDKTAVAER